MPNEELTKGMIPSREDQSGPPPSGANHLLAIGINAYQHWPPLNNAVKDVQDMMQVLQEEYQFAEENTTILLDADATEDNIIGALERLTSPKNVKPEDSVLIYYSGHGHVVERQNDKKRGFWVPVDARKGFNSDYLRNSTIREYVQDIPAMHVFLISDACFSGSLLVRGAVRSGASLEELKRRRSRWGLCSGRADEVVADGQPGQNSPFAAAIIDELKNNKAPLLNVQKLAVNVVDLTRRNYKQLPEGAPLYGVGDNGGQFLFERKKDEAAIWQSTLSENTITGFKAYIAAFPEGKYVKDARSRIYTLQEQEAWQKAVEANSIHAYNKYLLVYPEGFHRDDAMKAIQQLEEESAWQKATRSNRLSAFHTYLQEFPQGKYVDEAHQRIENLGKMPSPGATKAARNPRPESSSTNTPAQKTREQSKSPLKKGVLGAAVFIVVALLVTWLAGGFSAEKLQASAKIDNDGLMFSIQHGKPPFYLTISKNGTNIYSDTFHQEGKHPVSLEVDVWQSASGVYDIKVQDHSGGSYSDTITINRKPPLSSEEKQVLAEIENNMVKVQGGSFEMGCKLSRDVNCHADTRPLHRVTVPDFNISRFELTQKLWQGIMGNNPSLISECSESCPVEGVNWDDIQLFLDKLKKLSGKNYRLPTEAEWEFAARGGNKSKEYFYSGSDNLAEVAWYAENAETKTHPVGEKAPNELGLYDMTGNVWEFCQDCWNENFNNAPTDGNAWLSGDCSTRVLRGGSWGDPEGNIPLAARYAFDKSSSKKYSNHGFRLARD